MPGDKKKVDKKKLEQVKKILSDRKNRVRPEVYVHQVDQTKVDVQGAPKKQDDITQYMRKRYAKEYKKIDYIKNAENENTRSVKLHTSEGTKLSKNGTFVLEISVAGSDFMFFRSEGKGIKGKATGDIKLEENLKLENGSEEYEEAIKGMVGEKVSDQIQDRAVFRKETIENGQLTKVKYSIGGCGYDNTNDMLKNQGDYSINRSRERVNELGQKQLMSLFMAWDKGNKDVPQNVEIMVRGHSRGAVAAGEGAMLLNSWIHKNYPQYENRVHFNVVLYDPVPGLGSREGVNSYIDFQNPTQDMKKAGMDIPLKNSDDTTVVMTAGLDGEDFSKKLFNAFAPQEVHGVKRLIMTHTRHSVNLKGYDGTQKDGRHFKAYTDENGEVYRSYGLSQLKPGVYAADQDLNMIQLQNKKDVTDLIDYGVEPGIFTAERRRIVSSIASDNLITRKSENVNTLDDAKVITEIYQAFLDVPGDVQQAPGEYQQMMEKLEQVRYGIVQPHLKNNECRQNLNTLIQATAAYIEKANLGERDQSGERRVQLAQKLMNSAAKAFAVIPSQPEVQQPDMEYRTQNADKVYQELRKYAKELSGTDSVFSSDSKTYQALRVELKTVLDNKTCPEGMDVFEKLNKVTELANNYRSQHQDMHIQNLSSRQLNRLRIIQKLQTLENMTNQKMDISSKAAKEHMIAEKLVVDLAVKTIAVGLDKHGFHKDMMLGNKERLDQAIAAVAAAPAFKNLVNGRIRGLENPDKILMTDGDALNDAFIKEIEALKHHAESQPQPGLNHEQQMVNNQA